ncbi:MAG TPA: C40 family peptidase [Acidimicrobiales bacterium]|nr:C40 family peptidase [Acidimicrobiales bacterium]
MAIVPAVAVGTAALAIGAFVVVLGSGGGSAATTPTFNLDALPAAAQDYGPYLEEGGLVCDDVDAGLLAAQINVSDPAWDPGLTTTKTYTYAVSPPSTTTTVPSGPPVPTTTAPPPQPGTPTTATTVPTTTTVTVTVTITYEGLLQQTASWWAANGIDSSAQDPSPGSGDPFDPEDAIVTLADVDCSLAAQMNVDALSAETGVPVPNLIAAAYVDGASVVAQYVSQGDSVPDDGDIAQVISALSLFELDSSGGGAAATTTVPGGVPAATTTVPGGPVAPSQLGAAIVAVAQQVVAEGVPYVWGGGSPTGPTTGLAGAPPPGYDCSGLALYAVYQASGGAIQLPHSTFDQVTMGQRVFVGDGGDALSSGSLEPGDLVFFDNIDPSQPGWDHVGIYVGGGDMVDAPETGEDVQVDNLATSFWEGVQWDVQRFG